LGSQSRSRLQSERERERGSELAGLWEVHHVVPLRVMNQDSVMATVMD
jgi:hypothetical protein